MNKAFCIKKRFQIPRRFRTLEKKQYNLGYSMGTKGMYYE